MYFFELGFWVSLNDKELYTLCNFTSQCHPNRFNKNK